MQSTSNQMLIESKLDATKLVALVVLRLKPEVDVSDA